MDHVFQSGQRAAQRGSAPKFSLSQLFREICALRALCRVNRKTLQRLSKPFAYKLALSDDSLARLECSLALLVLRYYGLRKTAFRAFAL